MKKALQCITIGVFIGIAASQASATVITFDDLPFPDGNAVDGWTYGVASMPTTYAGFNWIPASFNNGGAAYYNKNYFNSDGYGPHFMKKITNSIWRR